MPVDGIIQAVYVDHRVYFPDHFSSPLRQRPAASLFTKVRPCGARLPLVFRAAFKPTPSIAKEQDSVDLKTLENVKLTVKGRHDPCVVLRAVPAVESACAIAILDALLTDGRILKTE